jgi:hypothetical protein
LTTWPVRSGRVAELLRRFRDETEVMSDNDADQIQIQEPGVPPAEPPQECKRSLADVLGSDLNTIAVATASAVAGAYAVKKILGGGPDDKDGGDNGPKADAP